MQTQLYLTPNDRGRVLTWDEFEYAEFQDGSLYELIDGRLEAAAFPNLPHEGIRKNAERLFDRYIKQQPA